MPRPEIVKLFSLIVDLSVYPKIPSFVSPFAITGIKNYFVFSLEKFLGLSPPAEIAFTISTNLTHLQLSGI